MIQQTTLEALDKIKPVIGEMQSRVYNCIKSLDECTDRDIVRCLDIPINCVTARRNELYKMGLIRCVGKKVQKNGRSAMIWSIKNG